MSSTYVLGHSEDESHRLTVQARLLAPITQRFLLAAGLVPGMRVLDVGSGMGDVALLTAELVGPQGEVVGTDRVPAIVAAAAARLGATQGNVRFVVGDPSEMAFEQPFDAVVGRYVLPYQLDLVATLSRLSERLRPGGVMVFHELDWGGARSVPQHRSMINAVGGWLRDYGVAAPSHTLAVSSIRLSGELACHRLSCAWKRLLVDRMTRPVRSRICWKPFSPPR